MACLVLACHEEACGQSPNVIAELARLLDDEVAAESGEVRGYPVELLGAQTYAGPRLRVVGVGRFQGRQPGGELRSQVVDGPGDADRDLIAPRHSSQARQHGCAHVEVVGQVERAGQRHGMADPVDTEGPDLAGTRLVARDVPASG